MNERGNYAASTYKNHFGSWSAALEEAFDDTSEAGATVSNDELIAELQRIADKYRTPPRFEDMREHGAHRARTYTDRFDRGMMRSLRLALSHVGATKFRLVICWQIFIGFEMNSVRSLLQLMSLSMVSTGLRPINGGLARWGDAVEAAFFRVGVVVD